MRKLIKKAFVFFLIFNLCLFILYEKPIYSATSYKKIALPLLAVSILAGVGAGYLRKKAVEKYDEYLELREDYKAIVEGQPNEIFEAAYEKSEDKYAEAKQMRMYYLLCGGGAILCFAGGMFLLFYNPSSKKMNFGYNFDFQKGNSDFYFKVRF